MNSLSYEIYSTPVGDITLASNGTAITHLLFGGETKLPGKREADALTEQAYLQLLEYFSKKRTNFTIPLCPSGTDFQKRVWDALCTIPYGETCSYEQIAILANSPRACRAVGMANHNNPIAIIIPCHRVVGKDGSLTGYGGGMDLKQWLLDLEH